jgi:hypothetical protein
MFILSDRTTKLIRRGFTGKNGTFHLRVGRSA